MTDGSELQNIPVGSDVFCKFFEVAVHSILYTRGLYPPGVFENKKKYSVPVKICIHPDVQSYVTNIVDSISMLLKENAVEKVMVVIVTQENKLVERFVFEVARPSQTIRDDKFLFRLEESLRGFLLKINVVESLLRPLPTDCTWSVQVCTKESAARTIDQEQLVKNFPWVQADDNETLLEDPKIVPIKAVQSEFLQMQLYAEESTIK